MAQPGQRLSIPASQWNRIIEATDYYHRFSRMGTAERSPSWQFPTDRVRVQNVSGSNLRQGEVVEFGDFIPAQVERGAFVLEADKPSATGSRYYGILHESIPDDQFGECLISGVCKALVDINSTSHRYARVAHADAVLQSVTAGPYPIMYAPASTGEQECLIRCGHAYPTNFRWAVAQETIAAATGGGLTMGFGEVKYYYLNRTTKILTATSDTEDVYNPGAAIATDDLVGICWDSDWNPYIAVEIC